MIRRQCSELHAGSLAKGLLHAKLCVEIAKTNSVLASATSGRCLIRFFQTTSDQKSRHLFRTDAVERISALQCNYHGDVENWKPEKIFSLMVSKRYVVTLVSSMCTVQGSSLPTFSWPWLNQEHHCPLSPNHIIFLWAERMPDGKAFLATLVALHFITVSEWVIVSTSVASKLVSLFCQSHSTLKMFFIGIKYSRGCRLLHR